LTSTERTTIVTLICLLAYEARADDDHERNYLVGERAVGLGGAFTAISDDSSATWYNPAGIAETPWSSFSLTAAVYGFVSNRDTLLPGGRASDDSSFVTSPSTAAWIQMVDKGDRSGIGRLQLAAAILSPRNSVSRRRLAIALPPSGVGDPFTVEQRDLLEVRLIEDEELWGGLGAAYKLSPWLSVGAMLYGTLRTGIFQAYGVELTETFRNGVAEDRRLLPDRAQVGFGAFGLVGVFGVMMPLGGGVQLGASFRTQHFGLSSNASLNSIELDAREGGGLGVMSTDAPLTFHHRRPWRAAIGAAYVEPRAFGLSADLSLEGPIDPYAVLELDGDPFFTSGKRLNYQVSFGAEYYLARVIPVRFGFFTNRSALEPCPLEAKGCHVDNPFVDAADRLGISGGIGYEVDRATLTVAWSYNFGSAIQELTPFQSLKSRVAYLFVVIGGSARF
jgi:hypothetical protein